MEHEKLHTRVDQVTEVWKGGLIGDNPEPYSCIISILSTKSSWKRFVNWKQRKLLPDLTIAALWSLWFNGARLILSTAHARKYIGNYDMSLSDENEDIDTQTREFEALRLEKKNKDCCYHIFTSDRIRMYAFQALISQVLELSAALPAPNLRIAIYDDEHHSKIGSRGQATKERILHCQVVC